MNIDADITNNEPIAESKLIFSSNAKKPTTRLVIGSSVLIIDAFCPPIINVPHWNKTTICVVVEPESIPKYALCTPFDSFA